MTDHHDEMRVSPDPSHAEELRQRLHTRMATVSRDVHDRSGLDLDLARLDLDLHGDAPATEGDAHRHQRHGRRPLVVALAAVAVLALVAGAVALLRIDRDDAAPITTDPPATTVPALGDVPVVWYDARGLHHDGVVEQTPVELVEQGEESSSNGALALVRSGAVYLEPATDDVWFQPWGGEPRIVGHNSPNGPGGDPNGDTAAWFEGGELVVYDTATGREISRTGQGANTVSRLWGDHWPAGNGFLEVSAQRVVWIVQQLQGGPGVLSYDLRTQRTSAIEVPTDRFLMDVHDRVQVSIRVGSPDGSLVVSVPGQADQRYPDLEGRARLSPSGNYFLGVEDTEARHGAVIVDIRTGEVWPVPRDVYPWIAWSYGDIALVDHTEDALLLACDAARQVCEELHPDGTFLMPTN